MTSSPPSLLVTLFCSDKQTTSRMKHDNKSAFVNLGGLHINTLSIKKNLDGGSPYVELKDSDTCGRPPKVSGSVPNIKARRSTSHVNTVVWVVKNASHHAHVRIYCTKFESQTETEQFLLIFNALAAEAEERRVKISGLVAATPVVVIANKKTAGTTAKASSGFSGVCPNCNNGGTVGEECDNCAFTFEKDNGSSTEDDSDTTYEDDDEESITSAILLTSRMAGMAIPEDAVESSEEESLEDDFPDTQPWPEEHPVSYPGLANY